MPLLHSEDQILEIINSSFPKNPQSLLLGRGDDCTEFAPASALALSTDLFLEDIHFRSTYFTPAETGHKALAVNLSDLASAGAVPTGFSLGFICPKNSVYLSTEWLTAMFEGMAGLARQYNLPLSGGDISAGPKLGFCITVWGESVINTQNLNFATLGSAANVGAQPAAINAGAPAAPAQQAGFLRRGAKEGQLVFVISRHNDAQNTFCPLGLARVGLLELEKWGRDAALRYPAACLALLRPEPLVKAGQYLAHKAYAWATAHSEESPLCLMDLSDGLLRDLPRLLRGIGNAHNLGVQLEFNENILAPELHNYARVNSCSVLEHALAGGDDYLLLGAANNDFIQHIVNDPVFKNSPLRLDILGRVTGQSGLYYNGEQAQTLVTADSFDHFQAS